MLVQRIYIRNSSCFAGVAAFSSAFPVEDLSFNSSKFVDLVCSPFVQVGSIDAYTAPASDAITRVHSEHLDTYILPPGMKWPGSLDSKQMSFAHKNVCFERSSKCNINRDNEIIRLLQEKKKYVCVVGSPGIGKSASTNLILMRLLQSIFM